MGIKFIRIDDRLIHGQVVTAWIKNYLAKRILIIDDGVAKDNFLKGVLKIAAPSGVELCIEGTQDMPGLVHRYDGDDRNTVVLLKTPETAKKLFDAGVSLRELNVGGMGANRNRKALLKNVSASPEEVKILKGLEAEGVRVYLQTVPADKQIELGKIKY